MNPEQKKSLQYVIDYTYHHSPKSSLDMTKISDDNFKNYYNLLKKLPNFLKDNFGNLVDSVTLDYDNTFDKNDEKNKYQIIWLFKTLINIYKGNTNYIIVCYDWELEYDFYQLCNKLLNTHAFI